MKKQLVGILSVVVLALGAKTSTRADAVTEWNAHWEEAVFATSQPVPAQARFGSILHLAIFDAVNGIQRKYSPYLVHEEAPPGARADTAPWR